MKSRIAWLLAGLLLFLLGAWQDTQYDKVGIKMTVTISRIESWDEYGEELTSTRHKYYADYTYGGKAYKDVLIATRYTSNSHPDHQVGDAFTVVLNPRNPGERMSDGGMSLVIGFVMTIYHAVMLVKERRKAKKTP